MATLSTEIPEVNYPLVAGLGIVAVVVLYILYKIFAVVTPAANSINSVGAGAAGLLNAVTGAGAGIVSGVSDYVNPPQVAPGSAPPSSGSLFWSGVDNFFSGGSIFGNQGSQ